VSEIINWSSANNSVLKINSLKYLLVFSFCNQILITSSRYKLNKTGDCGHPYLTPWVIALESSDIPLPALTLMFTIYNYFRKVLSNSNIATSAFVGEKHDSSFSKQRTPPCIIQTDSSVQERSGFERKSLV